MSGKSPSSDSSCSFIAREGKPLVLALAAAGVFCALVGWVWLTVFFVLSGTFAGFFFRDPKRVPPEDPAALISPADGKVIDIKKVPKTPFDDYSMIKISVFMSVFNVHINRVPFNGIVEDVIYHPGRFFSANMDKASGENEHNAIKIRTESGQAFWVVQIAGLIARRIICYLKKGDGVTRGKRFGLICFGSRLDLYLPEDTKLAVALGDITRAGETIIGYMP